MSRRAHTVRGAARRRRGRRATCRFATSLAALSALLVALGLTFLLLSPMAAAPARAADDNDTEIPGAVWVTQVDGVVDPAMARYLAKTMTEAAEAGAAALVIQIDTPGGLDTSMRDIIQAEIDSPIPVVFYVYPQGARAASAGLYILMGADVAAMAPQTNLGAATPVSMGEEMDETMEAKVVNDAAAYIRGLATSHGRNADWAEQAVREAVSLPAEDALEQNVIDFVAPDLPTLLEAIDGYVTTPKNLTLQTAGAPINEVEMTWVQRFLHVIASPDIAYILMTIGVLGIITEISTPGLGAAGIGGVISLLLAFYAFQVLPVSLVGVALIILAMILFVAEIKIQSSGVLGIGGAAALIAGGLLLFEESSAPYFRVSLPVLITTVAIVFVFFMIVIRAVAKAMRRPHATGLESMVGATGVAASPLSPQGQVKLHGETWKASTQGDQLPKNTPIEVIGTEGLNLIVRPRVDSDAAPQNSQNKEE